MWVLGRRTSFRFEPEFWDALEEIADGERITVSDLLTRIAREDRAHSTLSSAVRVYALQYYRSRVMGTKPAQS